MAIEHFASDVRSPVTLIHPSKITIPPPCGMTRPHLVARVEAAAQGTLTVLAAPAGWGKSTLLAQWAASTGLHVAWVSLDEGDDDPVRFLRALVASLNTICPLQTDDLSSMLRSPGLDGRFETVLSDRLATVPRAVAIVLDDVHVLTATGALPVVGRLLEHLPPHVHLLLASRGEPDIPLARLRSAGAVAVLGSDDLAFTVDEATEVLASLASVQLANDDARILVERTEGWIAGLRLAGASLAHQRDPHAAIERLRGTHRDIADYFSEEVLDRLGADRRALLVETSILTAFCPSLAAAVTGRPDAHRLITQSAGSEPFLVPLDDERDWYRYHGLFRETLQTYFAGLPAERQTELHLRASRWYEGMGDVRQAVEHALAADDVDGAAALIERHADTLMFVCGETNLILGWFARLPEAMLIEHPGLLRIHAWGLTAAGRIDEAEQLLGRLRGIGQDGAMVSLARTDEWAAQLSAIHARISAYRGDHRATIEHGRRALERLDPLREGRLHGDVMLSIGFAHRSLGNPDAAATAFAEAARLGRLHGNVQAARWGVSYLAITRVSQGRLTEAAAIVDEDLDRVRHELADPGSMLPSLLISKAQILIERNDLAAARSLLEVAIPLVQRVGDAKMLHVAYIAMGLLLRAEGDLAGAQEKMRRAEDIFPSAIQGARVAWIALIQGNVNAARRWAQSSGLAIDGDADPAQGEDERIIFARIVASVDPSPAAQGLVRRLIEDAEAGGRYGRAIELLAIQAVAASRAGDSASAHRSLGRALAYAWPEGFVQVFLNEGPAMRALLRDVARDRAALDGPSRRFAIDLLGRFPGDARAEPVTSILPEPLTGRQLEILRLLAEGHSNREIADHLYIAEGTVKAHIHQIFGKLAARNRTEAVAAARELHLLT